MAVYSRTFEDVDAVLQKAKLEFKDFQPMTQSLMFSDKLGNDDLLLLEIDDKLLDKILKHEKVVLRGEKNDEAVLCTENQTFDVKAAEISNALLLFPDMKIPDQIDEEAERSIKVVGTLGIYHEYFELRLSKPYLKRIRQVLENNLYCGEVYENDESFKHTLQSLMDVVQASESEISEELVNMNACYIKGYWRLLDHDYQFRVVSHIMEYIDANYSAVEQFPKAAVLDALDDLEPRSVLEQVLSWYSDKIQDSNDQNLVQLNERNVCRFYAEVLLRPADRFVLSEFLEAWKNSVPEGLTVNLQFLEDMTLKDTASSPPVIWFFPLYNLPEAMGERFNHLFKTREKWTYDEITPFIQNLTTEKLTVNAMLTKFARTSSVNGVKLYNSKKPVT